MTIPPPSPTPLQMGTPEAQEAALAQQLYARWVTMATEDPRVTPAILMLAAVGTVAELVRANRPPATWDDAIQTVATHILLILKGPSTHAGQTPVPKPRRHHRKPDAHHVRRRPEVQPDVPDHAS